MAEQMSEYMSEHTPTKLSEHCPERFPAFMIDDVSEYRFDASTSVGTSCQSAQIAFNFQGGDHSK